MQAVMEFGVVSALPQLFDNWRTTGVIGRAFRNGTLGWHHANPHDFSVDNYQSIDDTSYGGGPGMVMQIDPLLKALESLVASMPHASIHLMAPEGKRFTASHVDQWLGEKSHICICGRYEGIDQRFIELVQPHIWSIGDLVLAGGELAAMSIMEAVARHAPGVLGNTESSAADSFSHKGSFLDHPHYTRPEKYANKGIPEVLKSGNHTRIANWRKAHQSLKTWDWRPDLIRGQLDNCDLSTVKNAYASRLTNYFQSKKDGKNNKNM